jgi:hypothetical protein
MEIEESDVKELCQLWERHCRFGPPAAREGGANGDCHPSRMDNRRASAILLPSFPLRQQGPTCGLVASAVAIATAASGIKIINQPEFQPEITPEQAAKAVATTLPKLIEMGLTTRGEIHTCEDLVAAAHLIATELQRRSTVPGITASAELASVGSIVEHLRAGRPVCVPYDCDRDHTPFDTRGAHAHWCVVVGAVAATGCAENGAREAARDEIEIEDDSHRSADNGRSPDDNHTPSTAADSGPSPIHSDAITNDPSQGAAALNVSVVTSLTNAPIINNNNYSNNNNSSSNNSSKGAAPIELDGAGVTHVVARHGKTSRLQLWDAAALVRSAAQLEQTGDPQAAHAGCLAGLRGRMVVFRRVGRLESQGQESVSIQHDDENS